MADNVIQMSPSKMGQKKSGKKAVLALKESLTYQNIDELKASFEDCIDQNKTEIILDCQSLSFLDSAALEFLVEMQEGIRSHGGVIKLFGLNQVCRDIMTATRLINSLNIYQDIHEAIKGAS